MQMATSVSGCAVSEAFELGCGTYVTYAHRATCGFPPSK